MIETQSNKNNLLILSVETQKLLNYEKELSMTNIYLEHLIQDYKDQIKRNKETIENIQENIQETNETMQSVIENGESTVKTYSNGEPIQY